MVKVLFVQETLSLYNDPIFQIINKSVDLSFAYTQKNEVGTSTYHIFQLPFRKIGPFYAHKRLRKILNQYDVVVIVPHLRLIKVVLLPFFPHKFKLVSWSIGLHVTYNKKYDLTKAPDIKDRLFQFIQSHCDACIFYMSQPIKYWRRYSKINEEKYFVAHNTVKVADFEKLPDVSDKDKYLFVGTLYQQKGLGELIEAYAIARNKRENLPKLYIIGKGSEEQLIKEDIKEKGLSESVVLTGAIYDEELLRDYFLTSLLCISPKQAGLSVQKSLGYGVPFVTRPNSITGGERLDIKDKENGFFYNSVEELSDIMVNAATNRREIEKMSCCAREYYLTEASPEKMAQGVLDAIEYVMNK